MKRLVISLALTIILLGSYFLIAYSVRRHLLFGPGPFTIGKLASDYVRDVRYEDDGQVLVVFVSVSVVSVALPIFALLSILSVPQRSRLP